KCPKESRYQMAYYMRHERSGHTLQPTALVHEAFLRLTQREAQWKNKSAFLAIAAPLMRRILVDYSRGRHAAKRRPSARSKRPAPMRPSLARNCAYCRSARAKG